MNYETHNGGVYCNAHNPKTVSSGGPASASLSGRRASEELQQLTAHIPPMFTSQPVSPFDAATQPAPTLPAGQRSTLLGSKSVYELSSGRTPPVSSPRSTIEKQHSNLIAPAVRSNEALRTELPALQQPPSHQAPVYGLASPPQIPLLKSPPRRGEAPPVSVSDRIKTFLTEPEAPRPRGPTNSVLGLPKPPRRTKSETQSDANPTIHQGPPLKIATGAPVATGSTGFGGLKAAFEKSPPGLARGVPVPNSGTHARSTSTPARPMQRQQSVATRKTTAAESTALSAARKSRPSTAPVHASDSHLDDSGSDSCGSSDRSDDDEGSDEEGSTKLPLNDTKSKWRSEPGNLSVKEKARSAAPVLSKKKNSVTNRSGTSSGEQSIQSLIRLNVTALTKMENGTEHPRTPDSTTQGSQLLGATLDEKNRKMFSMSLDTMLSDSKRKAATLPQSTSGNASPSQQTILPLGLPPGGTYTLHDVASLLTLQATDLISIYENFGRFRARRSVTSSSLPQPDSRKSQMEMALAVFRTIMDSVRRIIELAAALASVKALRAAALRLATKEREAEREIANQGVCDSLDALRDAIHETVAAAHAVVARFNAAEDEVLIKPVEGFRLEAIGPDTDITPLSANSTEPSVYSTVSLEHVDDDAGYYRRNFYGHEHKNYIGDMPKLGPVIISLMYKHRDRRDPHSNLSGSANALPTPSNNNSLALSPQPTQGNPSPLQPHTDSSEYWAIMRSREGTDLRAVIQASQVIGTSVLRSKHDAKAALQMLNRDINPSKLRKVADPTLEERLLKLDELQYITRYKFGILFCKAEQTTEEEFFGNEHGSQDFETFLSAIGDKVPLLGWHGYAAGLDTKNGQTGTHSVFTHWRQFDVMFHVSTYLPHKKEDRQQIQRKRHIGNDIVSVVFLDGPQDHTKPRFDPKWVKSQFLHVFIAVHVDRTTRPGQTGYGVMLACNVDVPWFGPELPTPPVFWNEGELRDFLMAKSRSLRFAPTDRFKLADCSCPPVVNGENAAYKAPKFRKPHLRTRNAVLDEIVKEFGGTPSKSHKPHPTPAAPSTSTTPIAVTPPTRTSIATVEPVHDGPRASTDLPRRQSVFASLGGAFTRRASVPNTASPPGTSVAPEAPPPPPLPPALVDRKASLDVPDDPHASPVIRRAATVTAEALLDKKKGLRKLGRSKSSKTNLKAKSKSTTALSSTESLPDQHDSLAASGKRKQVNSNSLLSAFSIGKRKPTSAGDDKKSRSNDSLESVGDISAVDLTRFNSSHLSPSRTSRAEM
ncbi:signal-induced proliferation-associated 1-like protein 3 [Thoreauomyces humboldtii]|nr:signal-induced proliferation-associated 1-like protein 3 [Thoreauomyces humboldtii]